MKSSNPGSAWWVSSKTITTGDVAARRSKNVRHAANSSSDPMVVPPEPALLRVGRQLLRREVMGGQPGSAFVGPERLVVPRGSEVALLPGLLREGVVRDLADQRLHEGV